MAIDSEALATDRTNGSEDRLVLRYRAALDDYASYLRAVRWAPIERIYGVVVMFGLITSAGFFGIVLWIRIGDRFPGISTATGVAATAVACAVGVAVLFLYVLRPLYLRSIYSGQNMATGETVISIDDTGITSTIGTVRIAAPWAALRLKDRPRHYVFFYSRVNAFILPKRALANDADRARLADFLRVQANPAPEAANA